MCHWLFWVEVQQESSCPVSLTPVGQDLVRFRNESFSIGEAGAWLLGTPSPHKPSAGLPWGALVAGAGERAVALAPRRRRFGLSTSDWGAGRGHVVLRCGEQLLGAVCVDLGCWCGSSVPETLKASAYDSLEVCGTSLSTKEEVKLDLDSILFFQGNSVGPVVTDIQIFLSPNLQFQISFQMLESEYM